MARAPEITVTDGVIAGPVRRPVNAAARVQGSIHNDEVATKLGFRGGTVAGSIHMDQFPPLVIEAFGERWFEQGSLSLYFVNATMGGEPVRAFVGQPAADRDVQVEVWMERDGDGTRVAEGTASVGDPGLPSALKARDLRLSDPSELRILSSFAPGYELPSEEVALGSEEQRTRIEKGLVTEPLDWYIGSSPWGGPVACPSTVVSLLYTRPARAFAPSTQPAVGLFGAIEIGFAAGPLFLDRTYRVSGEVVGVGQSPKTEYVWFDSAADDLEGRRVARMRMLLRWMKASSPLYNP